MDSASSPPEIGETGVGPRWRTSSPATKVATGKLPADASIRSPQTRPSMSGGAQRWISVTETTLSKPMPRPNTAMPAARPGRPPMNGAAAIPDPADDERAEDARHRDAGQHRAVPVGAEAVVRQRGQRHFSGPDQREVYTAFADVSRDDSTSDGIMAIDAGRNSAENAPSSAATGATASS